MGGASNFHPLKFRIFHEIYQPSSDWLWKPLEPQQKFTASRDLLIVCPRRRLRDNACQLRAEILRYEEDTKPLSATMVPWSPQRNRSILGLSWDFHMS